MIGSVAWPANRLVIAIALAGPPAPAPVAPPPVQRPGAVEGDAAGPGPSAEGPKAPGPARPAERAESPEEIRPSDEADSTEPQPAQAPEPEPVPIRVVPPSNSSPAEPGAAGAPGTLPAADRVVAPAPTIGAVPQPLSHEPLPPSGAGMKTGGIFMIVDGALRMVGGVLVLATVPAARDEEAFSPGAIDTLKTVAYVSLGVGVAEIGGGTALVVLGQRRKRGLDEWQDDNRMNVPRDGNGMLVGGGISLGLGALQGVTTGVSYAATGNVSPFGIALAVGWTGVGAALLTVGGIRHRRFQQWRSERHVRATPFAGPTRGGATFGVSGRF